MAGADVVVAAALPTAPGPLLDRANEQLRWRARQQEAVAQIGLRFLAGEDLERLLPSACELVARLLEVRFTAVLEHGAPPDGQLLLRACHGWPGRIGEPLEPRFAAWTAAGEGGEDGSITAVIAGEDLPFGLLGAHSPSARAFAAADQHFLQSIANVLAAAAGRQQAKDAKIEFLSRATHKLRTPLNAILGFGQLLEIDQLTTGQRESVEQIISAGRHLLCLVNEVLDIGRIESRTDTSAPEPATVPPPASGANNRAGSPAVPKIPVTRTILHIEDNQPNQRLMELLLAQRPSLRLLTATRGQEGLELARTRRPDLILLDMNLPDISGKDVLKALRTDPLTKETTVVVISADVTIGRQANLQDIGANDYLTKPFNVTQFLRLIDGYLACAST